MKTPQYDTVTLDRMISGGQAIGTLATGKKALLWNALPGETVRFRVTKKKSSFVEGIAEEIMIPSPERVAPRDPDSYLSTSPWQIMIFAAEQHYKAALIEEAFELHNTVLPDPITVFSDGRETHYRNKVEFSWYGDEIDGHETLDLAFFRRGSKGKVTIDECSLLPDVMLQLARTIRDLLAQKHISARALKTLLIRANADGACVWQLYVKDRDFAALNENDLKNLASQGGEIIYSDPKSPASRITERLVSVGDPVLRDTILGVPFRYATEGFFQVNLPIYEQALRDMRQWVKAIGDDEDRENPVIDLYSGVGTIGLTIGGSAPTLVEINADAVREMKRNVSELGSRAQVVLAPSEHALNYLTSDAAVIVDPPRAGLHPDVVAKLLEIAPPRIIYLSCNPVTQARDVALLAERYGIRVHQGYNFFPRTPHIEHMVVLDRCTA